MQVNLKKELQNERIHSEEEIGELIVSEVKALLENNAAEDRLILNKLGLDKNVKKVEAARGIDLERKKIETEYNEEVFTVKEIKNLAIKYDLRFLQTNHYEGNVSPEVPARIKGFAKKYGKRVGLNGDTWSGDAANFFILAPRENFKLQKAPKDPMLFYKVDGNPYSLQESDKFIHVFSWGNDFTITRRIKGFTRATSLNHWIVNSIIIAHLVILPILGIIGMPFLPSLGISLILGAGLGAIWSALRSTDLNVSNRWYTENGWNSDTF